MNRRVRLKLREVRLLIRVNSLRYHWFPLAEAPLKPLARLLQSTHQHGRILEHYHRERNHQGLDNELIAGAAAMRTIGPVRRRARLGGPLNYYARAA